MSDKYSKEVSKLVADGSKAYGEKNYELASEKYGEACQIYNETTQEEDPELLFLYGKALFQNAVSRSEVFGGDTSNLKDNNNQSKKNDEKEDHEDDEQEGDELPEGDNFQFHDADVPEEDNDAADAELEDKLDGNLQVKDNVTEEEEEQQQQEEDNGGEHQEEEQSDFEVAWEILDLTRSIWEKELESISDEAKSLTKPYDCDSNASTSSYIRLIKKLAETYDILGEVSLEAENFPQAALDLEKCLELRQDIYDKNSSLISESHYKLSLALEFCVEDESSREKATNHTKLAIESIKARNIKETDPQVKKTNLDLIKDLEIRYQELKKDPNEDIKIDQLNVLKGILGQASDDSVTPNKSTTINQLPVKRKVNDLNAVVKKKKPSKDTKK